MINLLIGPPGGGKSYEAVVYHVLPALRDGRKVITNLPLILEMFARLDPDYLALIDLKKISNDGVSRPFGHISDYGDMWRHPETGTGPLYIIDEAHEVLPKSKIGSKPIDPAIGEWFATHRHEFADVLIITQHYGRVSSEVIDRLQLVYRVKKMTAFGKPDRYIRKVQDGLRGDVVDMSEREYEKHFFGLYVSHTRAISKGVESGASDVTPRYKKFIRWGLIICGVSVGIMSCQAVKQFGMEKPKPKPVAIKPAPVTASSPAVAASTVSALSVEVMRPGNASEPQQLEPEKTPFDGMNIHVSGYVESSMNSRKLYLFTLSQNGQGVSQLSMDQMKLSGYQVTPVSSCVAKLQYGENLPFFARCDAPQIQMAPTTVAQKSSM